MNIPHPRKIIVGLAVALTISAAGLFFFSLLPADLPLDRLLIRRPDTPSSESGAASSRDGYSTAPDDSAYPYPPAESAHLYGFRDSGALQDDAASRLSIPLAEIPVRRPAGASGPSGEVGEAGTSVQDASRSGSENGSHVLPGRASGKNEGGGMDGSAYYSGMGASFLWAEKQAVPLKYRRCMPARPLPSALDASRQEAFAWLQAARDVLLSPQTDMRALREDYAYAVRRLHQASLRFPDDVEITAAVASALNTVAFTLPTDQAACAFTEAAKIAESLPNDMRARNEWGIALYGLSRAESGEERARLLRAAERHVEAATAAGFGTPFSRYASAGIAAAQGRKEDARQRLAAAAEGRTPITTGYVIADPAFTALHAEPWFAGVAAAFPPAEPDAPGSLGAAEESVAAVLRRVAKETPGNDADSLVRRAVRLAVFIEGDHFGDDLRRSLLTAEADRLFTEAEGMSRQALRSTDYLLWGTILRFQADAATKEGRDLWVKAIAAYEKARDPHVPDNPRNPREPEDASVDAVAVMRDIQSCYAALLAAADPLASEDKEALYRDLNASFERSRPRSTAERLLLAEAWAYSLANWAQNGPPERRRDRSEEAVQKLRDALALAKNESRDESGEKLTMEAGYGLAALQLFLAPRVSDHALRRELLTGAERAAVEYFTLQKKHMDADGYLRIADLCLELARTQDEDMEKKARYAQWALYGYLNDDHAIDGEKPAFDHALHAASAGALEELGIATEDTDAKRELFFLASTILLRVLEDMPQHHRDWAAWGISLNRLAQTLPPEEGRTVLVLCRDIFARADCIAPGSEAYNTACIEALLGNLEAGRFWLERAAALRGLPSRDHLERDTDMDPLRHLSWFQKLLEAQP